MTGQLISNLKAAGEGYHPEGYWLWDPWILRVDEWYHLFHLQLPLDYDVQLHVPQPLLEQSSKVLDFHSSIGMARSRDLVSWETLGTVLSRGDPGEWDDLAIWTGNTFAHEGRYYLFYTGRSMTSFWQQRIGLAMSEDLVNWKRHSENPIVVADETMYGTDTGLNVLGMPPAWRDPFVFLEKSDGRFHMLVSARGKEGDAFNACVGHAVSDDLVSWQVLPPFFEVPGYDQIENPQIRVIEGRYYLFFSTRKAALEPERAQLMKWDAGLFGYVAEELHGPYRPVNGNGVILGEGEQVFSVQVLPLENGNCVGLGWWQLDARGEYIGRLTKPFGLQVTDDTVQLSPFVVR